MLQKEKRYEFKSELLQIHKKDRRDYSLEPKADEYVLPDCISLVLPEGYDIVAETAARDFEDYLFTSMGISAMVCKGECQLSSVRMSYNKDIGEGSGYMGYRITVTDGGITLEGYDSEGIAQGLYYLEDLMNLRHAPFLEKKVIAKRALFSPRFAQSPFGMFEYNDECLAHMAHLGYDAIMLWIKGLNINKRGEYIDMPLLCDRAERYGIKVYIQLYADHYMHPDDEGAQEFYDKLYGDIFKACPKIKGIELVGEANHFHSKDPDPRVGISPISANYVDNIPTGKYSPGFWPCRDYPQWVAMIRDSIYKYRPDADIVFCTYNWSWAPAEDRAKLVDALPKDITLLASWDMCQTYDLGGAKGSVADYSLRQTAPSDYFASEAASAKRNGLRLYATTNSAGLTWDFGVIGYEPAPYAWIKRYENMLKAHDEWGLCGMLECIHYGFYPSFISDLEKAAFFTHEESLEDILSKILIRDFGCDNLYKVDKAMRLWSEAISHAMSTNEDQYGAFRIGPSYPLWVVDPRVGTIIPEQGRIPNTNHAMFGNGIYFPAYTPDYNFNRVNSMPGLRIYEEIKEIDTMKALLAEGIELMESIENPNDALLKLINMGKFMYHTCITGKNVKRLFILTQKLHITSDKAVMRGILDDIEALLLEEKENVEATIPVVQLDSRLGWEPSMEYQGDEECLKWKLRQLEYDMTYTLPKHRASC